MKLITRSRFWRLLSFIFLCYSYFVSLFSCLLLTFFFMNENIKNISKNRQRLQTFFFFFLFVEFFFRRVSDNRTLFLLNVSRKEQKKLFSWWKRMAASRVWGEEFVLCGFFDHVEARRRLKSYFWFRWSRVWYLLWKITNFHEDDVDDACVREKRTIGNQLMTFILCHPT